jgi:hypothetical protein
MLGFIPNILDDLLRNYGKLIPEEVDVTFENPVSPWRASLIRPTVNLFLFDLHENTELRTNNFQISKTDKESIRRLPPRRIDTRFLVTPFANTAEDEYALLSRLTGTLLQHDQLPAEVLPEVWKSDVVPVRGRVCLPGDGPRPLELWNQLGAEPQPSVMYALTVPLDLEIELEAPLVLSRQARYTRLASNT